MRSFRVNDLEWVWSGDLVLNDGGDVKDTSRNPLLSFIQEARTRVRSDLYDWAIHPHIGAGLSDFIGEPNTKQTAESGKARIIAALIKDDFCNQDAIDVRYVPVDRHQILYRVKIALPDVAESDIVTLNLLLTTDEFQVTFL